MSNQKNNDNGNPFAKDLDNNFEANEETKEELQKEQMAEEPAEPTSEETVAEMVSKEEYENLKNQYVRLAADFDNYRKRQAQERESLLKYGAESTMKQLLPVLDTYYRAQKACESIEDTQKLRENFEVIFKQLFDALDKAGLKKIETVGTEFDPNVHEAVMQTPTNEHPDNSIVEELQAGYMLIDRVLRPAMVSVAVNE